MKIKKYIANIALAMLAILLFITTGMTIIKALNFPVVNISTQNFKCICVEYPFNEVDYTCSQLPKKYLIRYVE